MTELKNWDLHPKEISGAERLIAAHLDRVIDANPDRYKPRETDNLLIAIEPSDSKAGLSTEAKLAIFGAILALITGALLLLVEKWLG